eukprot:m.133508 g.133508  ORF g.133508 m.133508 type:complete len:582 (-) comp14673_c1_seq6:18-1763(-)
MMAFKNTVVFATLLLSLLVGAVALTEEEEQLLADLQKKKAEEEFKKASPSGPQIRTERGEDGGSDVMFIVDEGSKVGMQVGDEKTYFNDFQPNMEALQASNINAISVGVAIGQAHCSNFTQALMGEAAKVPALEVKSEILQSLQQLKENLTLANALSQKEQEDALDTFENSIKDDLDKMKTDLDTKTGEFDKTLTALENCAKSKGFLVDGKCIAASVTGTAFTCNKDNVNRITTINSGNDLVICVAPAPPRNKEYHFRFLLNDVKLPRSCKEIKLADGSAKSGKYTIKSGESAAFEVYCDMETNGGGWTLVASVHEDNYNAHCNGKDRWRSTKGRADYYGDLNWQSTGKGKITFGTPDKATQDDYKNPGYWELDAEDVMITHVRNNANLNTFQSPWLGYYTTSGFLAGYQPSNLAGVFRRYQLYHCNTDGFGHGSACDGVGGGRVTNAWSEQGGVAGRVGTTQKITFMAGNQNTMWSAFSPNYRYYEMRNNIEKSNYVTFFKLNWEGDAHAICPGNYRWSQHNNAEHQCWGGGGYNHEGGTSSCTDFNRMGYAGVRAWGQGSSGWTPNGNWMQSTILHYYR